MITDDACEGCGVPLQSDQPDAPGYVPAHVARRGESVICRRCFRINNYGKEEEGVSTDGENAWSTVMDVVSSVDLCVMVVDVLDFEGSFVPLLAQTSEGRLIVAANKIDLLPTKTPAEEVAGWIDARLEERGIKHQGIFSVSARTGYGVRVLLESARRLVGRGGKLGIVGATNVGKSTLVNRWLKGTESEGPTVSRFPGTTLGVVGREMNGMEIEVLDTPGLLTRGRVTDIVCHSCATRLVPESPLTSKLIRLTHGQAVVIGGLAAFVPVGGADEEHMLLAFAAGEVPIQKIRADRVESALAGAAKGVENLLCDECRATLKQVGWEQVVTHAREMEDVAVHGLGWISPRRKGINVKVSVPAGVLATTRPRLIGPKSPPKGGGRADRDQS